MQVWKSFASSVGKVALSVVLAVSLAPALPASAFAAPADPAAETATPTALQAGSATLEAASPQDATPQAAAWDGSVDTSWYNANDTSFTISTPAQLAGLAHIVKGDAATQAGAPIAKDRFTGKTVTLAADIVLNESPGTHSGLTTSQKAWVPIGDVNDGHESDNSIYFDGTFDGGGHKVVNIYADGLTTASYNYGGYQGLFGALGGNAVVRNVGVEGGYISGRAAGGIAAISHVVVSAHVPQIIGCYNTALIEGNGSTTRGIGGIFGGEATNGAHDTTAADRGFRGACYIANCYNTGAVKGGNGTPAGGIAGAGSVEVYGCYTTGAVSTNGEHAAALVGVLYTGGYQAASSDGATGYACYGRIGDTWALTGTAATLYYYTTADDSSVDTARAVELTSDGETWDFNYVGFKSEYYLTGEGASSWLSGSYVDTDSYPQLYWQKGESAIDITAVPSMSIDPIGSYRYTGSPIEPPVSVYYTTTDPDTGYIMQVPLAFGADYTVAYADNTAAGTATATVTGFGRYHGTLGTVSFTITTSDIDQCVIEPILAQWYTGVPSRPAVVVTTEGGSQLEEGTDYTVEYSDNDKPGTAKVTVKAQGASATGEASATFQLLSLPTKLAGSGTAEDPYLISTKAELEFLAIKTNQADDPATRGEAYQVDASYGSAHYKLSDDIDATSSDPEFLTDRPADPLFETVGLSGVFDGNGKTVTLGLNEQNVWIDMSAALAFIVKTSGSQATIKDLSTDGSVVCAHGSAAGILLAANADETVIEDCANAASVRGDQFLLGGAAGIVCATSAGGVSTKANLTLRNCTNTGAIASSSSSAGGIVSILTGGKNTLQDCRNTGMVTAGSGGAGGIVGNLCPFGEPTSAYHATSVTAITGCSNAGRVIAAGGSGAAGGIIGYNQSRVEGLSIDRSYNEGAIRGSDTAGGLVGQLYNVAAISNCYNVGEVRATASWHRPPGGIVGHFTNAAETAGELKVTNSYNAGTIGTDSSGNVGGGILGFNNLHSTAAFVNCYYDTAKTPSAIGDYWEGAASCVVEDASVGMDADSMKTPEFVNMLGSAFSGAAVDENTGLPVIKDHEAVLGDITTCDVEVASPWQYTGSAVKPAVTVKSGTNTLTANADYVVFYNVSGTQGTATVWGIGDWEGSQSKSFTITPCDIAASCRVSNLAAVDYADIAGGQATQEIVITNPAGTRLQENVDYQVAYANNDAAGTAYVLITGMGPYYTGQLRRIFTIRAGDLSALPLTGVQEHYPLSSTGLFLGETLTAPNGYALSLYYGGAGDYYRVLKDSEGNPLTNSDDSYAYRVTKAGHYTAEIIGLAENGGQGNWKGTQSFEFDYGNNLADAQVAGIQDVYGYTNAAISIAPVLTDPETGDELVAGDDYTVKYLNAAGRQTAQVRDSGSYTAVFTAANDAWFGEKSVAFRVSSPDFYIADECVALPAATFTYTGSAITPQPVVKVGGRTLTAGTHYTVTYADEAGNPVSKPTDVGAYRVIVAGVGNYSGTVEKPFEIASSYFTVCVQYGASGAKQVAKAYTAAEFAALKSDSSTPVSGMYHEDSAGAKWKVVSTNSYVTLQDLLDDAGVRYTLDGSTSLKINARGYDAPVMSMADLLSQGYFYPDVDPSGRASSATPVATPPVFALSSKSSYVESTTAAAQVANLASLTTFDAPRLVYGISAAQLAGGQGVRGFRYTKNANEVVVILPEGSAPDSPGGSDSGSDSGSGSNAPGGSTAPASTSWKRLYGENALGTMKAIVQEGFASSDTVVVATIDGYWDALAASALAGAYSAPVLMTAGDALSAEARDEIARLGASRAFIVGGPAAVSDAVDAQVKAALAGSQDVTRLYGDNAVGTAQRIAAHLGDMRGQTCIIATSGGYWDALAASSYAYAQAAPIYLTDEAGDLPSTTLAAIRAAGYERAVIVGGTAVVSASTEGALAALGISDVQRKAGQNAYDTAREFASWALTQGMVADNMGVATASGYWDALAGAALCGKNKSVLVLADDVDTTGLSVARASKASMAGAYVFGGPAAVGDAAWQICAASTRR